MPTSGDVVTATRPAKKGMFRGWYIVGVGFLSHLASATTLPSTLGVFFKPMSEEFAWPRAYLSSVRSFESIFTGLIVAIIGSILDRYGSRIVMTIGGTVAGLGFILLGFVNDSLQFFIVRGVLVCAGYTMFSHVVASVAVSNWFVRKRGRALGISGAGQATGKIFMAPVVTMLMGIAGWRAGWVALGLLVLVMVPLPAFLFLRRRPEDLGLRPDGDDEPSEAMSSGSQKKVARAGAAADDVVWTRTETIRTSAFWLIILTFSIGNVGLQGWALHAIPYLTDIGFSPTLAAMAVSMQAIVQVVSALTWGMVVERVQIRYCTMAMFLIQAVGISILLWLRIPVLSITGLCIYGISLAGNSVIQDVIWANYFGRLSLGTVRGVGMPILMLVGAGGPFYFGYLYDLTGGYELALQGFIAALTVASFVVLACRPPKRRAVVSAG